MERQVGKAQNRGEIQGSGRRQGDADPQGRQLDGNRAKKLSDEDQKYVAQKEEEDDPFKAKSDDDSASEDKSAESDDDDKPAKGGKGKTAGKALKTVEPDWSKAETIASSSEAWKLEVPAAPSEGVQLKARAIGLPAEVDREQETEMIVSPSAGHALVGSVANGRLSGPGHHHASRHTHRSTSTTMQNGVVTHHEESSVSSSGGGAGGSASDENAVTRLTLCDLVKGKALGTGTMAGKYVPIALDEGGTRVLVREDKFGFEVKALELWNLTSSGPKAAIRWWPGLIGEKNGEVSWGLSSAMTGR